MAKARAISVLRRSPPAKPPSAGGLAGVWIHQGGQRDAERMGPVGREICQRPAQSQVGMLPGRLPPRTLAP